MNYFTDGQDYITAKIAESNILYFSGGLPHLMMERLQEKGVIDAIRGFNGLVMGDSAGALIQLDTYHVTPDRDYPEYAYYDGLGLLHGFDLEVHYCGSAEQKQSIKRCSKEKGIPVYAIPEQGGILAEKGIIRPFGKVAVISDVERIKGKSAWMN